jgi:hypothetical protein
MKFSTRGLGLALLVYEVIARVKKVRYSFRGVVVGLVVFGFLLTAYLCRYEPVQGSGRYGVTMVYDRWLHRQCFVSFPYHDRAETYACDPYR